jgi:[ribosomal protein S5]-alanine N-acetyltransferase
VQTTFAIVVDGEAAGSISLVPGTDVERISAEIGYWIGKAVWGRGVMTDAVRATTTYAFDALQLNRVFAVPFADNLASARVLEKAGYTREGSMRRSVIKDGRIRDQLMLAAYDDTWRAHARQR